MEDNVHPAVVLIVERMKSHPEEFAAGLEAPRHLGSEGARWGRLLERMDPWLSDADKAYLDQHFRALAMERIHHDMLDELMNGPERRAEEQRRTAAIAAQQAQLGLKSGQLYPNAQLGLTAYQAQAYAASQGLEYTNTKQTQLGSGITGKNATSITVDELKDDSVLDVLGRYILKLGDKK
jgi:hypothetical protein